MPSLAPSHLQNPFDLQDVAAYQIWRDAKIARYPRHVDELIVEVNDPRHLSDAERRAILARCADTNMAVYRSSFTDVDRSLPRVLGAQLGLTRLDGNWLADDSGISLIAVASGQGERSAYIPYTDRAIKWHTDGYYHPAERTIRGMILHCVRSAQAGGENALMDPEMAYIAVRDTNPDWLAALMAPDAMTIPQRTDENGVARATQSGPVFSVDAQTGVLHMRYTARTRSIHWRDDATTRAAAAFLAMLLASDNPCVLRLTLQPGMGLVCNNVLHDRSEFADESGQTRLLYRARYLDRVAAPDSMSKSDITAFTT